MNRKIKIILFLLLIPILLLVLTGCTSKEENQEEENIIQEETSIMWEVTPKNGEGKLYLLGSIHIAKEDMYPLNETIMNAFNESNKLVVENDIIAFENNPNAILEILEYLLYTDGTTIRDHIPASLLSLLEVKINNGIEGIEKDYAYYYRPITYYSMIMEEVYKDNGFDFQYGVDRYFLKEAKSRNMEIVEVETVEFQYSMLANLSDDIQSTMLASALLSSNSNIEYLKELVDAWEEGNLEKFENVLQQLEDKETEELNEEELQFYLEYNKKIIDDRNISMTEKAVNMLNDGNTYFYIVGAAHMIGENGIVQKLVDQGYTVEKK